MVGYCITRKSGPTIVPIQPNTSESSLRLRDNNIGSEKSTYSSSNTQKLQVLDQESGLSYTSSRNLENLSRHASMAVVNDEISDFNPVHHIKLHDEDEDEKRAWDTGILRNLSHSTIYLVEDDTKIRGRHFLDVDSTRAGGSSRYNHRLSHSNASVSSRTERVTKSRKLSPQNVREYSKEMINLKRPDTPKTPMSWSSEDDVLLRDLKELRKLGWKEIAAYFPKRTAHACQFRWRRLVSGTLKGHKTNHTRMAKTPILPYLSAPLETCIENIEQSANKNAVSPVRIKRETEFPTVLYRQIQKEGNQNYLDVENSISNGNGYESPIDVNSSSDRGNENFSYDVSQLTSPSSDGSRYNIVYKVEGGINDQKYETDDEIGQRFGDQLHIVSKETSDPSKYPPNVQSSAKIPWTVEEDALLVNRRLSFDEVSILLRHRSEEEIWARMGVLRSSVINSSKTSRLLAAVTR